MFLFGNKLVAAEKCDDESLVGTADIDDLGSSMVEAQKSALTSLSLKNSDGVTIVLSSTSKDLNASS